MKTHTPNPATVMGIVVDQDRCSGCGVCAAICPQKDLTMGEAPNGDLTAQWAADPCTTACGLCLVVCGIL